MEERIGRTSSILAIRAAAKLIVLLVLVAIA